MSFETSVLLPPCAPLHPTSRPSVSIPDEKYHSSVSAGCEITYHVLLKTLEEEHALYKETPSVDWSRPRGQSVTDHIGGDTASDGRMPKATENLTCHVCDYVATHRSNLTRHMQRHLDTRPHACKFCDYRASEKSQLTKHTLRHTRERPHACNICAYRATKKSDLKAHMRVHTGERPHECHLCDYKAAHKSTLTAHLRRHAGEKPHACDICDYRSTTKSDLTKHKRIHNREQVAATVVATRGRLPASPSRRTHVARASPPLINSTPGNSTPTTPATSGFSTPVHMDELPVAPTAMRAATVQTITPQTATRGLAQRRGYEHTRPSSYTESDNNGHRRTSSALSRSSGRMTPVTPASSSDSFSGHDGPSSVHDISYGLAL
eukprot:m.132750 g.132750  ORF g.132750 m.132750 type:complete len:378 (+) comp11340_c0_seq1:102-1235(+)